MNRYARISQWVLLGLCVLALSLTLFKYNEYVRQVDKLRAQDAQLRSQTAIIRTTLTDIYSVFSNDIRDAKNTCLDANRLADMVKQRSAQIAQTNGQLAADLLTVAQNVCTYTNDDAQKATDAFVSLYMKAVTYRALGKFTEAGRSYRDALAAPKNDLVRKEWKIRALEGEAYSALKTGDFDSARSLLASADKLDYNFVFSRITAIKLMCLTNKPRNDVAGALDAVRKYRDSEVERYRAANNADLLFYSKLDRQYVETDDELFLLCRSDGVSPRELPEAL